MMATSNIPALLAARRGRVRVTVGTGSCGIAAGAKKTLAVLRDELAALVAAGSVDVIEVGCAGRCFAEPLVEVTWPDGAHAAYGAVESSQAGAIAQGIVHAIAVNDTGKAALERIDCMPLNEGEPAVQVRRIMDNAGAIDPRSIDEYRIVGGYAALNRALAMKPTEIIELVEASGLRGRGGAGYSTGAKWRAAAEATARIREADPAAPSYLIMNGDEGDPGAYMNRSLLESDPHKVLEGLIIAAYAVGAHRAYLFIRAEYPLACDIMRRAIDDAYAEGLLGESVANSGFALDAAVIRGAGAYLNGEETALIRVLEDGLCLPRRRPPYPAESGLWGAPTCVNNVETLANVPFIVSGGVQSFRKLGTPECPGTKLFSVVGAVERCGIVEVPLGTPLADVVKAAGGAPDAKAVQIGGPSGGILPLRPQPEGMTKEQTTATVEANAANSRAGATLPSSSPVDKIAIDYESLALWGAIMGSGGFVVIGRNQCMVDIALYFMRFSQTEACGRCHAAAKDIARCVEILDALTHGTASNDDVAELASTCDSVAGHALCGLCKSAANVVRTALRYFPDEFEAHTHGMCPGLTCRDLISYEIDTTRCQGERCCLLTCPGNAIKGRFGTPGRIVARLCQKCGMCAISCPYGAVRKVTPPST